MNCPTALGAELFWYSDCLLILFIYFRFIKKNKKGSASECVLVALLSARSDTLRKLKAKNPFVEDGVLLSKLVMYTSKLVDFFIIISLYTVLCQFLLLL
jgi:hypothetical protein